MHVIQKSINISYKNFRSVSQSAVFGVAQRKRGGPITLRSLDRNQAPKTFWGTACVRMSEVCLIQDGAVANMTFDNC